MESSQQPPQPTVPPQPASAKKKGGCLKIFGIVVAVIIVLVIIVAVVSGPEEKTATSTGTPATTTTATQEEAAPEPEPAPEEPVVKPKVYSGSGKRIVKIKKPSGNAEEPVIATISHTGQSNFAVWTLDRKLKQNELLVNTIGSYKGTVALDFEDGSRTERIQFEADGAWKMTLRPISEVRRFSNKTKGRGDDVVHYTGGPKVANISHTGSSNFAVWYYGEDGRELLVNEVGKYKGQSPFSGEALIVITADGAWAISAK